MVVIVLIQLFIIALIIYAIFDVIIPIARGKETFSIIKSLRKQEKKDDSKYKNLFKE